VQQPPAGFVARHKWLIMILIAMLAFGGTWASLELVVWNRLPPELVGKWVVTEGPQEGATFDFYRSGKMVAKVNDRGKFGIINADIRIEGKTLFSTSTRPTTGEEYTSVMTIRTLTDRNLIIEDDKGMLWKMRRAD
jgi:uncharacterized protein (TIGR03066 family)